MTRRLRLSLSLLLLAPASACGAEGASQSPPEEHLPEDTPPHAMPMDSDAFQAQQNGLNRDEGPSMPTEAESPEPERIPDEDVSAPIEPAGASAPAVDADDPSADPLADSAAPPSTPLALHVSLSAAGLTLSIEDNAAAAPPSLSALVLRINGEGVDSTQRFAPHTEQTVDPADSLPDGAYRYEVSVERAPPPTSRTDFSAVDQNGRNADDPAVRARDVLPRLPRASGSFQVERGALLPPTVEPSAAATEPQGTP